ncbi:uncharacterized protein LOC139930211 [Centroberyx gerrardi]
MARFVRRDELEIMEVNEDHLMRANSVEGRQQAAQKHGGRLWIVGVSFGLLCILQAALNVSLRLTLYSSDSVTPGIETGCKALTEERDQLERKLNNIGLHKTIPKAHLDWTD